MSKYRYKKHYLTDYKNEAYTHYYDLKHISGYEAYIRDVNGVIRCTFGFYDYKDEEVDMSIEDIDNLVDFLQDLKDFMVEIEEGGEYERYE